MHAHHVFYRANTNSLVYADRSLLRRCEQHGMTHHIYTGRTPTTPLVSWTALAALSFRQVLSDDITVKQVIADKTEKDIDEVRRSGEMESCHEVQHVHRCNQPFVVMSLQRIECARACLLALSIREPFRFLPKPCFIRVLVFRIPPFVFVALQGIACLRACLHGCLLARNTCRRSTFL